MKKKLLIAGAVLTTGVVAGLAWGTNYLFDYAIVRGEKDFLSAGEASGKATKAKNEWDFATEPKQTLNLTSTDGLNLVGQQFKQKQEGTPKLAVLLHGYTSSSSDMTAFGKLFYNLGYDIFLPDARGHGQSEGDYIGFGWPDRLDLVAWLEKLVTDYNSDVEIVLYGISMGAATVMMASGEELPTQVKAIIEDCGYDTVENELAYQLQEMFSLPAFPLVPLTSVYTDLQVGYNFKEASSIEQLKKNYLPVLFIHGQADKFVPTKMVYPLYEATQGPKEIYLVPEAKHAQAYSLDKEGYREVISSFLETYG